MSEAEPADLESGDYVGCVAGNLRAAVRVVSRLYDTELRGTGLRITQIAILATIRTLQPVTLTHLATALAGERSAVARDLAILERSGLVQITVKADDRRAREVQLTPAGWQRLIESAPAWRRAQQVVSDTCGPGTVAELVALSARVIAALEHA